MSVVYEYRDGEETQACEEGPCSTGGGIGGCLDGLEGCEGVPLDFAVDFCQGGGGDDAYECGESDGDEEDEDCGRGGVASSSVSCPI